MESITCDVDANYDDKRPGVSRVELGFLSDGDVDKRIWLNVWLSEKRADDYLTVSFRMSDLLQAIGKAVESEIKR